MGGIKEKEVGELAGGSRKDKPVFHLAHEHIEIRYETMVRQWLNQTFQKLVTEAARMY